MNLKHYSLLLLILLINISLTSSTEIVALMRKYKDWGKQHGVFFSKKIGIEAKSVNEKSFKARQAIGDNEKLLSIPLGLVLSVSNTLLRSSLTNEKIHQLHNYTFNETSFSYDDPYFNNFTREVIYLTLVRYYCDKDKEYSQLKQFYAPYFDTYEDDVSNFPLFYNENELKPLHLLDLGIKIIVRKAYSLEESFLIKTNFDLDLNEAEYSKYRHLAKAKSLLVNNKTSIVPFFELFDLALKQRANCEWKLNKETNQIEVYSLSPIKIGEALLFGIENKSNDELLLDYGKTIENNSYIIEYFIDYIHHSWREEENLQWVRAENETYRFNMMNMTFKPDFVNIYKEIAKEKKLPETNESAYDLMIKNFEYYLKEYDVGNDAALKENIINDVNRINIKRILDNEKKMLQNCIEMIQIIKSSFWAKSENLWSEDL